MQRYKTFIIQFSIIIAIGLAGSYAYAEPTCTGGKEYFSEGNAANPSPGCHCANEGEQARFLIYDDDDNGQSAMTVMGECCGGDTLPKDIGGDNLALWLDASDRCTIGVVDGTDRVRVWHDKSGNRLDVKQSSSSKQPEYSDTGGLSSIGSVKFDGGDELVRADVTGGSLASSDAITIFIVQKYKTPVHSSSSIFWESTTNSNRINIHALHSSERLYFDFGDITDNGRIYVEPGDIPSSSVKDVWRLVGATRNSTSDDGYIYLDGSVLTANTTLMDDTLSIGASATLNIGSIGGSGYLDGNIGEIIIFKSALDSADRITIEDYLIEKWGL